MLFPRLPELGAEPPRALPTKEGLSEQHAQKHSEACPVAHCGTKGAVGDPAIELPMPCLLRGGGVVVLASESAGLSPFVLCNLLPEAQRPAAEPPAAVSNAGSTSIAVRDLSSVG